MLIIKLLGDDDDDNGEAFPKIILIYELNKSNGKPVILWRYFRHTGTTHTKEEQQVILL